MIYDREFKHKYSVTSHLINKDGTYIAESLARSKKVWIKSYDYVEDIILTNVKINKSEDYDDVYTISVDYEMSREN